MNEKLTPEVAQKLKEMEEKKKAYLKTVRDAINAASSDPNVLIILRHVMKECGFRLNPIVVNSQTREVAGKSTEYNVGRLSVYLALTLLMDPETENLVEKVEV